MTNEGWANSSSAHSRPGQDVLKQSGANTKLCNFLGLSLWETQQEGECMTTINKICIFFLHYIYSPLQAKKVKYCLKQLEHAFDWSVIFVVCVWDL